jgi:hypothetical protein
MSEQYLYQILYPNNSLVGSMLPAEQFAKHYISGSSKYYAGKLIFASMDISYRNEYFRLDEMFSKLVRHEDGRPKSTKYVSNYRVLEHTDFEAIQKLYIATPEGYTLELESQPYTQEHGEGFTRIFSEITPVQMMVLSVYNFPTFGKYITDPEHLVSVPKAFYTQIELEIDDFMDRYERNPLMASPIPNIHPSVLRDGVKELRKYTYKNTKGLSLTNALDKISFKHLRHGFMFADKDKIKYFPLLPLKEIEKNNYKFWKHM